MNDWKSQGIIRIADEVIAVVARIATLDTDGVHGMSGGIAEGIAKRVSGKPIQKGIQVIMDENETTVDLRVVVQYGQKIDFVCKEIQRNVKEMVFNMTGIDLKAVNVRVESVDLTNSRVEPVLSVHRPSYMI